MPTDVRFFADHLELHAEDRLDVLASLVRLRSHAGQPARAALRAHGSRLVLNYAGEFPGGVHVAEPGLVVQGPLVLDIPADQPLPHPSTSQAVNVVFLLPSPGNDSANQLNVGAEIARLRKELFFLKLYVNKLLAVHDGSKVPEIDP